MSSPSSVAPVKSSFGPAIDRTSRVLILGSLPGEVSLQRGEYYAHPRNGFWPLMQEVTGAPLVGAVYADRLALLRASGVGLWDVIQSAERKGSLDADIRRHTGNDLAEVVSTLPSLRAIAFNGLRASAIGRKLLGPRDDLALLTLPSSSPAFTMSFDRKLERWRALRPHLQVRSAHA